MYHVIGVGGGSYVSCNRCGGVYVSCNRCGGFKYHVIDVGGVCIM